MQSVNFNSASKAQAFTAVKHSNSSPASVTNDLKKDSVSFTGKGEAKNGNASVIKQIVKAVIGAVAAVISFIIGKIAAKPETPAEVDTPPAAETAPKADVIEPKEAAEAKNAAEAAPTETAEITDEAQKEILKLVNGAEKEIKDFGVVIQGEAKEIHTGALNRIDKLVEIAKNDGKDSEGKTVGEIEYQLDKNAYSLVLKKDDGDVSPDRINLEIGTNRVLSADIRFEDMLIRVNSDVMDCAVDQDRKHYFFNREKGDELKAYTNSVSEPEMEIMMDYRGGEVAEYSEMSMMHVYPVIYPRHAAFLGGEMVRYQENTYFEDGNMKFEKGYAKTSSGTWKDLTQE